MPMKNDHTDATLQSLQQALAQAQQALSQAQVALAQWVGSVAAQRLGAQAKPEAVGQSALQTVMERLEFLQDTQGLSKEAHAYVSDAMMAYLAFLVDSETEPQSDLQDSKARSSAALLAVINDLLEYSQILKGELQLKPETVQLQECLRTVHARLMPVAQTKHLDLALSLADNLPVQVQLDVRCLHQVLSAVVGHALHATAQGHVAVSVDGEALDKGRQGLRIEVSDTSGGLGPDELAQVFEPFVHMRARAQWGLADPEQGSWGLGLAMARSLLNLLGGTIEAHSTLGQGTRFIIHWPLQAFAQAITPANPSPVAHVDARLVFRVLVVDDHPLNRLIATSVLRRTWPLAQVDEAEGGLSALAMLQAQAYDLVLMDLVMPDVMGLDVVRQLRTSQAPSRQALVLALTAHTAAQVMSDCQAAGVEHVLHKPLEPQAMVQAVQQALATVKPLSKA